MGGEDITFDSATRDVLISTAKLIGSTCVDENLAFTKCKAENSDPEACLKLGHAVLACNNKVLLADPGFQEFSRMVNRRLFTLTTKCPAEFEAFRKCMDNTQMNFGLCRKFEKDLNEAYHA